ncbi:MAG: glycosyltransferase [Anaerolineales bacterium]|nr:glycosyltransferase [Anaerolineales bacterium]
MAAYSGRLYPTIPLLNGFCFFVRRKVVDAIGLFDEENFGAGYGEEDDFVLRARAAGWQAALADDAYVYHAQSKSYSHERRRQLAERAGKLLVAKHGQAVLDASVALAHHGRVFEGIRARAGVLHERARYLELGRERFGGRKVLFVLPVADPGGGGNVVIDEALAMQQMGVEVALFNSLEHRERFSRNFPSADLPVIYGEPADLGALGAAYDAVVATLNTSVAWLQHIQPQQGAPVLGYYVQDFEPYMYQAETPEYARALASYTLIPDLVRLTKTEWNRQEVRQQAGVDCVVVGPSANIDLFRPRTEGGVRPLRVAAMVRPASYYRSPWLTMELLRQLVARYGDAVEVVVFGVETNDPGFALLPQDFKFTLAGVINQRKVARLLSEVDIFVDFSTHQAMGLTAMEAMACGDAVIVPSVGAGSFARHGQNCLMVNPQSQQDCWQRVVPAGRR